MKQVLIIREPWCFKKHVVVGRPDQDLCVNKVIQQILGAKNVELYYKGICDGPNGIHTWMIAQTEKFPYSVELYER